MDETPDVEFVDFAEAEPDDSRDTRERVSPRQWLWLLLLPLGFAFFLTSLFLAMRGVMDLGGMVAVGGPYEIAHPAPSFVWIFPVAIIACILIAFASMGMFSWGEGKSSLVALFFWPAIFLSLGWNFCEYGFFKSKGSAWGWVVCGILFVLMGGLPLYFGIRKFGIRKFGRVPFTGQTVNISGSNLWLQLLGVAVGIPLGVLFFSAIS